MSDAPMKDQCNPPCPAHLCAEFSKVGMCSLQGPGPHAPQSSKPMNRLRLDAIKQSPRQADVTDVEDLCDEVERLQAELAHAQNGLKHVAASGCPYESCVGIAESFLEHSVVWSPVEKDEHASKKLSKLQVLRDAVEAGFGINFARDQAKELLAEITAPETSKPQSFTQVGWIPWNPEKEEADLDSCVEHEEYRHDVVKGWSWVPLYAGVPAEETADILDRNRDERFVGHEISPLKTYELKQGTPEELRAEGHDEECIKTYNSIGCDCGRQPQKAGEKP